MSKTYLVTGGAGFIGSHLVDRLVNDGNNVVILDDFSTGKLENIEQHKENSNVTVYKRSITVELDDIFEKEKFDAIAHLAAIARVPYSIEHPLETNATNLDGTLNLLVLAQKYGVKRFVNYGSSSEYGDPSIRPFTENMYVEPLSPYGLQKFAADHYARLYNYIHGMETITLRPFNVYGPRMSYEGAYPLLIAKAIQWVLYGSEFKINGDGLQTRDFTYVDDMIEATMKALTTLNKDSFGQSFNVGASSSQVINEVVDKIIALCGKTLAPEHGPAKIEPRNTLADISKAKTILGWEPKANFDEALKTTFDYFELKK